MFEIAKTSTYSLKKKQETLYYVDIHIYMCVCVCVRVCSSFVCVCVRACV